MRLCRLLAGLCVAGAAVFGTAPAQAYSSLYVFGDSLSDAGNNAYLFDYLVGPTIPVPPGTLHTSVPIADSTFVPDYPYASGRYTNGPVWVEQFASRLGLSAQASLLGGSNYAFGGARLPADADPMTPPSLVEQVGLFLGAGGPIPADALYVVLGGGNDARDAAVAAMAGQDPTPFVQGYANGMGWIVGNLAGAGARHILLGNVPDVGKTPSVQAYGAAAADSVTLLAGSMNLALDATLAALPPGSVPDLMRLDIYGLMQAVYADPSAYGLTDATTACAASQACIDDPVGNFFWDGIHPTAAGHAILAAAAVQAIPEPAMVVLFAAGLALILAYRRLRT